MRGENRIAVIIPALNEEAAIGQVLAAIPPWVDEVVVVDNGSIDATPEVAREMGARVVREPQRGYGAACLAGIEALTSTDLVVFLDGDFSDHPEEMDRLVDPLVARQADLVIGSRILGHGPLTGLGVEGGRIADVVAGPHVGLHPEDVLGVAQVIAQLGRHLLDVTEQ